MLVNVKVSYHGIYGLTLTRDVDLGFTLGNLERQRRETLERLVRENPEFIQLASGQYFTRNKKAKLNRAIHRIALVASPKSEGYADFVHTIASNPHGYKFAIDNYYSSVQGIGAEQELVRSLIQIYEAQSEKDYDCVVITCKVLAVRLRYST